MLTWLRMYQKEVLHSIRTAVAAVGSLLIARFCRLPESCWAAVTAHRHHAINSWRRLDRLEAALYGHRARRSDGGAADGLCGAKRGGVWCRRICARTDLRTAAHRAKRVSVRGITLAIVMLAARAEPAWMIGIHRFLEISVGIVVGLLLTAVWPEPEPAAA